MKHGFDSSLFSEGFPQGLMGGGPNEPKTCMRGNDDPFIRSDECHGIRRVGETGGYE